MTADIAAIENPKNIPITLIAVLQLLYNFTLIGVSVIISSRNSMSSSFGWSVVNIYHTLFDLVKRKMVLYELQPS